MNENKILNIIKNAREKISLNEDIKDEIKALSTIVEYIREQEDNSMLSEINKELKKLKEYERRFRISKIEKKKHIMKIQRKSEYITIWTNKSLLYKVIHHNLNPEHNDFAEMSYDAIEQLIEKVRTHKKKR